jgi:CubicO group peptidase (beta-lactamase class C family)
VSARGLANLDEHLQRYIDSGRLAGALSVVYRNGEAVHFSALGMADRERGVPMREDTIFRLYSMTKPITSVALMQIFERGLIQLDDPVHRYIPAWENLRVYQSGVYPNFLTTPCQRPMTVRDLLSHQSGLTYNFLMRTNVDAAYRRLGIHEQCTDLQDLVDRLAELPLEFSPGTHWNYSLATDICAYLVQEIAGERFDQYLREHIFTPLGMVDTGFQVRQDQTDRFAANYTTAEGGAICLIDDPKTSPYLQDKSFFCGCGGLVGTAGDYLRFSRMLLNGGTLERERLLGRKTLELMTQNHIEGGRTIKQAAPAAGNWQTPQYAGSGFGLGFAVWLDNARGQISGTPGEFNWSGAASTHFWVDPREELTAVLMVQYLALSVEARYNLHREMRAIVYGALE